MLWIAVSVSVLSVAFLGFVLAGVVRELEEVRHEVEDLRRTQILVPGVDPPSPGLPIGSAAPSFDAAREGGGRFSSRDLDGSLHLVVFADPTCAACDALVPDLLRAAAGAEIPPTVVVAASGGTWPAGWMPPEDAADKAVVVRDADERIARAFASDFSPHVFVVDLGGSITAQGPAGTLASVRELIRDADGIQIIPTDVIHGS